MRKTRLILMRSGILPKMIFQALSLPLSALSQMKEVMNKWKCHSLFGNIQKSGLINWKGILLIAISAFLGISQSIICGRTGRYISGKIVLSIGEKEMKK